MAKTVADEWASYREQVIHHDAPWEQVSQLKDSFYAGCVAMATLVVSQVSGESDLTDNDEETIDGLMRELANHAAKRRSDAN